MREIVRMTAQKQPLEVGVPLYPFSHAGLFRKNEASHVSDEDNAAMAPLPVSPPFEEQQHQTMSSPPATGTPSSSGSLRPNIGVHSHARRPSSSSGWSLHEMSISPEIHPLPGPFIG